jgi:hypothetical protein
VWSIGIFCSNSKGTVQYILPENIVFYAFSRQASATLIVKPDKSTYVTAVSVAVIDAVIARTLRSNQQDCGKDMQNSES